MFEKRKKKNMQVSVRKFSEDDIKNKVRWINDPCNNQFLHYDLPLEYEKTLNWYLKNQDNTSRYDGVIEVDSIPVGLIGLIGIDKTDLCAEFYITLGEQNYKGKGVAKEASLKILEKAFTEYGLKKIFLYTEKDNLFAQKLFSATGFVQKKLLKGHIIYNGRKVDRYLYEITSDEFSAIAYTNTRTFAKV